MTRIVDICVPPANVCGVYIEVEFDGRIEELERMAYQAAGMTKDEKMTGCQRCGQRGGLDCVVPNEVWAKIQAAGGENLLCPWCIDKILGALGLETHCKLFIALDNLYGSTPDADRIEELERQVKSFRDAAARWNAVFVKPTLAGVTHAAEGLKDALAATEPKPIEERPE